MDVPSMLLFLGQSLFMVLPLTGLYSMRVGSPARMTWIKGINHSVATLGFVTLIVMFAMKGAWLGVKLCSANLGLRLVEWSRILQLHFRRDVALPGMKLRPASPQAVGRVKFRMVVKVMLGVVVSWALLFEGHHVSCKVNVQFCTNLLLQTSQVLGMVRDGRADQWHKKITTIPSACFAPTFTFSSVVASYHTKHPGSTWLRHEYNASRAPPKWTILLSSQASGSTWVRTELSSHPHVSIVDESLIGFARRCRVLPVGNCTW
jgi:hypothetical protein